MGQALPTGIPAFAETGWTREQLLDALANSVPLPQAEAAAAALYPDEIESAVSALLERAKTEHLDRPSRRLLIRGLVILGGRRYASLYRPLIAFLRERRDPFEVLPEVFANPLPKILAGVFDGDLAPLTALLVDDDAGEFVRGGVFLSLAFLTFDGRIPRETTIEFLRRFVSEDVAPAGDDAWVGWMDAVALLGLSQLSPRVEKAFDDGLIPTWVVSRHDFHGSLKKALERPSDRKRFDEQQLGYIDDVLKELGELGDFEEDLEAQDQAVAQQANAVAEPASPRELVEPPEGFSSFAQTGYTRQRLLEELSDESEVPVSAVKVALRFPEEIADAAAEALGYAKEQRPDVGSYWLLHRGLPILAAARYTGVYRQLIAFLHRPSERVEILGDMLTESLARIIAGVFDGDDLLLTSLIADADADEWGRKAAFGALTFLTFDHRVDRERMRAFLLRFDDEQLAPTDDAAWRGWVEAAALLGFDELSPRVRAAFRDGRIAEWEMSEYYYRGWLDEALRDPRDPTRFSDLRLGYIEDVFELPDFSPEEEDDVWTREDQAWTREDSGSWGQQGPARNPFKNIGRNDPCPCGSGKKYKKCCLRSDD